MKPKYFSSNLLTFSVPPTSSFMVRFDSGYLTNVLHNTPKEFKLTCTSVAQGRQNITVKSKKDKQNSSRITLKR